MNLFLLLTALASSQDAGAPTATVCPETVFERVAAHDFHPVGDDSFTVDRRLGEHGIADLNDDDWRVRLLAVRDLVVSGDPAAIAPGLEHDDVQVRYAAATALGILGDASALEALRRTAQSDSDALARSAAVIALGQIADRSALETLRAIHTGDSSKDVRHQAELAIDRIGKGMGVEDAQREAFAGLDASEFGRVRAGDRAPDFALNDTEGQTWRLGAAGRERWTVLVWVFADWCPVCHGEFQELIELREEFQRRDIAVATIETHGTYRGRVMVGKELDPEYWFAEESFRQAYTDNIWWPHLLDRAGAVGTRYGVDPMAYAVHAEYINRPAVFIIDPQGTIRFAYFGTYWGDRPKINDVLDMIRTQEFDYRHPDRLIAAEGDG